MNDEQVTRTFVAAVGFLLVVLVGLDLNGSSLAELNGAPSKDPGVVWGKPRSIRADEYLVETPIAVSSARLGFPRNSYIGLTDTSQIASAHGGPSWTWAEIFKPQDWGYLFLGPARGLAVHWWMPFFVSLLGCFWLFRVLRLKPLVAVPLAAVSTFTPYAGWWSAPSPAIVVGFATLTAAALLQARQSPTRWGAVLVGIGAGWCAAAFMFTLYPPWQISVGLVLGALVVAELWEYRDSFKFSLLSTVVALAVAVPAVFLWFSSNRQAIAATLATYYPGHRISSSGEATLAWLMDAPLNPLLATSRGATLSPDLAAGHAGVNLSEVSASWLPLPALIAVLLVAVAGKWFPTKAIHQPSISPRWLPVCAVSAAFVVLFSWATLPLPAWTGAVLLQHVPGGRVQVGTGLAMVILIALLIRDREAKDVDRSVAWVLSVVGVLLTMATTLWAANSLPWNREGVAPWALLLGGLVALGFVLSAFQKFRVISLVGLACFAFVSWSLINPLYRGIGNLNRSPITKFTEEFAHSHPGSRAIVFGYFNAVALVRAGGIETISGVTFYPDAARMNRLAPSQERLWNNYVQFRWKSRPGNGGVSIQQVHGTVMDLYTDPCDAEWRTLRANLVASDEPLACPCLQPVGLRQDGRVRLWFYQRV